ncbi:MAG: hypothetical protein WBQ89_04995, partial [Candidatus Acidiferrum sp.]
RCPQALGAEAGNRIPAFRCLRALVSDSPLLPLSSPALLTFAGGRITINGTENVNTYQKNSRIGATASIPFTKHQSLKFSYSNGDYVLYGGNYQSVTVAWQYAWLGRPN